MTVTVEWTATALLNLVDILDYVREQSPQGLIRSRWKSRPKPAAFPPIRSICGWRAELCVKFETPGQ
jgi:hypothetical protein